jgi:hypothetical protein
MPGNGDGIIGSLPSRSWGGRDTFPHSSVT